MFKAFSTTLFSILLLLSCSTTKNKPSVSSSVPSKVNAPKSTSTTVETKYGNITIPGVWEQFHFDESSNQHFLKNSKGMTLAVAKNPKNRFSFYKNSRSDFETVQDYYKWESDYRNQNGQETKVMQEDQNANTIIWSYEEKGIDNIFLYGMQSDMLVNYLIYTDLLDDGYKIDLLKTIYNSNK